MFVKKWNEQTNSSIKWIDKFDGGPHEANFLKLDCSKIKTTFGWSPRWTLNEAIEKIVEWTQCYFNKGNIRECMDKQIREYLNIM